MRSGDLTSPKWDTGTFSLPIPVYDEIQFSIGGGKVPAASAPSWEAIGALTCSGYAFSVDDYIDTTATELPHWWVEETPADCHIHFLPKTAQNTGANRGVKFTVTFAYATIGGVYAETPLTLEYTMPTGTAALTHCYLDIGDLTLTGYKLGTQIQCHVKRIASTTNTEYADDVYVLQVGAHLYRDRFGSKSEASHL